MQQSEVTHKNKKYSVTAGLKFIFFQTHLEARNQSFCIRKEQDYFSFTFCFLCSPASALHVIKGGPQSLSDSLIVTLDCVCFQKKTILGINTDLFGRLVNSVYKNSRSAWKLCSLLPSTIHLFLPSNSTIHHKQQSISSINKKIKSTYLKETTF